MNGDLTLIAHRIKLHLDEMLEGDPELVPELDLIAPEIEQYLRVSKQIERFTHLSVKVHGENQSSGGRKMAESATREVPLRSEESQD